MLSNRENRKATESLVWNPVEQERLAKKHEERLAKMEQDLRRKMMLRAAASNVLGQRVWK